MILFILRHPFWILFLLCLVVGGAAYYPISQGVKPEEVISWYQKKYQDIKFEVVTNAVESGKTDYIPQAIVDEVVKTKQKMEEEKLEAARPKSENYNENISRDKKVEEVTIDLKKRKSGFKKKGSSTGVDDEKNSGENLQNSADDVGEQKTDAITLDVEALSAGGLAGLLDTSADEKEPIKAGADSVVQEKEKGVSAPALEEKSHAEVLEQVPALSQKNGVQLEQKTEPAPTVSHDESADIPTLSSTESAIPTLLPDANAVVAGGNASMVKDISDNVSVPNLLPRDEKTAPSVDNDNNVVEKEVPVTFKDKDNEKQIDVQSSGAPRVEENIQLESNPTSALKGNVSEDKKVDHTPSNSAPVEDDIFSDEDFEELKLF